MDADRLLDRPRPARAARCARSAAPPCATWPGGRASPSASSSRSEAGQANISVRKLASLAARPRHHAGRAPLRDRAASAALPVIALLGLRGAGKTTIGRRLARRLHVPFVELDRRVEEAAGLTLDEIFALHGEDYYRRLERETLDRVLREARPLVLATGGGIVTRADTYAVLRQRAAHRLAARGPGGPLEPRRAAGRPAADGGPPAGDGGATPSARRAPAALRGGRAHRGDLGHGHGRSRPADRSPGRPYSPPRARFMTT